MGIKVNSLVGCKVGGRTVCGFELNLPAMLSEMTWLGTLTQFANKNAVISLTGTFVCSTISMF